MRKKIDGPDKREQVDRHRNLENMRYSVLIKRNVQLHNVTLIIFTKLRFFFYLILIYGYIYVYHIDEHLY